MHRLLLVVILTLSFPSYSAWEVKGLIRSKQDTIKLTYNGSVFSIATRQLREINFIFQSICARAEQSASLWIEPGLASNASARGLGNNRITINFGMISMIGDNQAEWAALIGHELAHLKLEHSKAGLKRRIPLDLARALINEKVENRSLGKLFGLSTQAIESHYSRKQENDSDYLGAIWAVEAGYSAWGAAGLHSKMLAIKQGNNYPEFLKSHPSSEKRVERLSKLAKRLDAQ